MRLILQSWVAEGQSLEECIDRIPREDVATLAASIANGLRAAHDGGIIHRDIKPSNIILTPSGEPKLLDFGLASVINTRPFNDETMSLSDLKTQEGTIMGTVGYMSPEQVEVKKQTSAVISLGVVLYELLKQSAFRQKHRNDAILLNHCPRRLNCHPPKIL